LKAEWANRRDLTRQGIQISVPKSLLGLLLLTVSVSIDSPIDLLITRAWENIVADLLELFISHRLYHILIDLHVVDLPDGIEFIYDADKRIEMEGCSNEDGTMFHKTRVDWSNPVALSVWRSEVEDPIKETILKRFNPLEYDTKCGRDMFIWEMSRCSLR
jgi:hypothetical protein